jgi:hypothetical protein
MVFKVDLLRQEALATTTILARPTMSTQVNSPTVVALVHLYLTPTVTVCAMRSTPALLDRTPVLHATTTTLARWVM